MSLKDKWMKKNELLTTSFEYQGETVEIRELSGSEKIEAQKIEDAVRQHYFIWNLCIISESLKLSKSEFQKAFEMSHSEIDYIVNEILKFSGGTEDGKEDISKN